MIRANADPLARSLADAAREIAAAADPLQRQVRLMADRIDRDEQDARQRLREAHRAPSEPQSLIDRREAAEQAQKAFRSAKKAEGEATNRRADLEAERPSGLFAWLTGRSAEFGRKMDRADDEVEQATKARREAEQMEQVRSRLLRQTESDWSDEKAKKDTARHAEAKQAEQDIERCGRARRVLREHPEAARSDEAFQEAMRAEAHRRTDELRRALDEQRRQQAEEQTHRPRGPTMGR